VENSESLFRNQGCQIFLGATYQNGEKLTEWPQNIPNVHIINIPNGCKILQMATNIPIFVTSRHSKIYPDKDFWFGNTKPCEKPVLATNKSKPVSAWPLRYVHTNKENSCRSALQDTTRPKLRSNETVLDGVLHTTRHYTNLIVCINRSLVLFKSPWRRGRVVSFAACRRGDWSYGSWDRIPPGYRVVVSLLCSGSKICNCYSHLQPTFVYF
jgi:hypothetical protein